MMLVTTRESGRSMTGPGRYGVAAARPGSGPSMPTAIPGCMRRIGCPPPRLPIRCSQGPCFGDGTRVCGTACCATSTSSSGAAVVAWSPKATSGLAGKTGDGRSARGPDRPGPEAGHSRGRRGGRRHARRARGRRSGPAGPSGRRAGSRSARPAATTAARWAKGCWSATRCAVPGTTPASACAPERRSGRRRSTTCRAGRWRSAADASGHRREAPGARPVRPGGRAPPERVVIVGGGAAGDTRRRDAAARGLCRADHHRGSGP